MKKVAEAADYAKKLIGCKIMQNKPYYRTAGHVQVRLASGTALQDGMLSRSAGFLLWLARMNTEGMEFPTACLPASCQGGCHSDFFILRRTENEHRPVKEVIVAGCAETGVLSQVEFNNQTLDKRCMSTVQLLLDIETLAHADYMTGTLNSGIPYLIEVRTPLLHSRYEDCCHSGAVLFAPTGWNRHLQ